MIPNVPSHSNSTAHSNQDQFSLRQQSQQQQQFNQFQQSQNQQQFQHHPQFQQQKHRLIQQQQQQPPPQNQHHQSLASHFHLLHLVENFSEVIDNGSRNQHSDALLNNQFEKCQQLLNSISSSINTKAMMVEG